LLHFVLPASLSVALAGVAVYLGYFLPAYAATLTDAPALRTEEIFAALLLPQSALTHFTLLCGLLLLVFAEPPFGFLAGGDDLTTDRRPAWLALALFAAYGVILALPPLRGFFDLALLPPLDHVLLAALVLLWALAVRWTWRGRWVERFLSADLG
jgi:cation-transporting ATPase E